MYDVIIIGAGPAGVSAGIYSVSRGKRVLVIEKKAVGGLVGNISTVTHYAGIMSQETGESFSERLKAQAEAAGIDFVYEEVTKVSLIGSTKTIYTENNKYEGKKVILASGTTPRKLEIPGEAELSGKGMGMNAARDGVKYAGKNVYVVGGADGAIKEAIFLSRIAKTVTIVHFEETLGCIAEFKKKVEAADNIKVRLHSRITVVAGSDRVTSLDILDESTGETQRITDSDVGIFVYAGATPNTELYSELKLVEGFVPTNDQMETELSGVYAIGDIRLKEVKQISTAVCDGTLAGIAAAKNE
ncbi:NAD(P)/FAD-dependent oxidoreductase [Ohessyouella blattaphilus]|uniref:NAD(P)/FAD-dependent oxidoreductase n=1 Tax=Ohessyouella blattaphilus TaxID=2949333 RepID=A0ABT1EKQ2_9FIRM|nr:NAD(P)/FAD-dependent oxidoreductase [Ohessyouella blattaphilus]MCP1111285.1 NAD(P)/FAD-dependent oxidoreductase [Ohessyouella blattaphilus]MCR8564679.1 NAD(P)/FAD-dependent oxidoreductase [Ohessyouella blattaphilus]MDL2249726.1 NAD(P)/FAD-dependent oxidoreductase [Lachnospiraceae bacterium OttesenSCG-928-J05]